MKFEVCGFILGTEDVISVRLDYISRNDVNDYCFNIVIKLKDGTRRGLQYSLIEAEYERSWKTLWLKKLVKYTKKQALAHPELDKSSYNDYLRDLGIIRDALLKEVE